MNRSKFGYIDLYYSILRGAELNLDAQVTRFQRSRRMRIERFSTCQEIAHPPHPSTSQMPLEIVFDLRSGCYHWKNL